jgi:mono/diheme cytochrome c family protein
MKIRIAVLLAAIAFVSTIYVRSASAEGPTPRKATTPAVAQSHNADAMRTQGEQRYRANCARCHAAPQKFPPRMMATVLRHMRVRATITDEDMRLVLFYMSQ